MAKREANLAAKEAARKQKVDEIKEAKAAKAKERAAEKGAADSEKSKEEAEKAELQAKRDKNIADRDKKAEVRGATRNKNPTSKYSKKDVMDLKAVFDEYDKDGSGTIVYEEMHGQLKKKADAAAPKPGEKSSLQQRKANVGVSLLDVSQGVFEQMDKDKSGDVTFEEMLTVMFQYAKPEEIQLMLSWVAPEPEPEPEPKAELSAAAKSQINGIFKLFDKDKSGTLTFQELKKALEKTGIDPDEIKQYFTEYDFDGNGTIDKDEFFKLMESTGAFDND